METTDMKIRLSREVKDSLAKRAVANNRSVNAEVVTILKNALAPNSTDKNAGGDHV